MRHIPVLALLAALTAGRAPLGAPTAVPLDTPEVEQALGEIDGAGLAAHMRFLADDLLEGRAAGTRGYELAARYVAAQFEALGLAPGAGSSYLQPVPLLRGDVVVEESRLSLAGGPLGKKSFTHGQEIVLAPDLLRGDVSLEAPVVFAGFGVTAPEHGYDDYAGLDVKGKVVAILRGAPSKMSSEPRAFHSSNDQKRANAAAHGAVGLIGLWGPGDRERNWERSLHYAKEPRVRWTYADGRPEGVHEQLRLQASLGPAASAHAFAGAPATLDDAYASVYAGIPRSFALPVRLSSRVVSRISRMASPNVVGVLRGSDPKLRDEYVVFSAHLDHLGLGPEVAGDSTYNGAYDNASGVSAMIEVASAFRRLPRAPRRSLLFLAVTGEEVGLLGSDYFAHFPTVPREALVADVNQDAVMMLPQPSDLVAFGAEHSTLGSVVQRAAAHMEVPVSPDPMPEQNFFVRSDQFSFVKQGVPAVYAFFGTARTAAQQKGDPADDGTALLKQWLKTSYHLPQDDMAQAMDWAGGARYTKVNFLIGYLVAQAEERPRWNAGDYFGERFGRGGARE